MLKVRLKRCTTCVGILMCRPTVWRQCQRPDSCRQLYGRWAKRLAHNPKKCDFENIPVLTLAHDWPKIAKFIHPSQTYTAVLIGLPTVPEWPGSPRNWHTVSRVRLILSRKFENWPPGMDIWLFTNECIVFCIVFVSHTRLDLSVMSLTNEIIIIRLAANTKNNDEMQQAL